MTGVAIVADTACDLSMERAAAAGITLVPLLVRFGDLEQRSGVEMSVPAFYERLLAPGSPFPSTAACSPGDFVAAFRERLEAGADAVICLTVGSRLSATHKAASVARDAMAGAPVHVFDTETVTLAQGLLVLLAAEAAAAGEPAASIVQLLEARRGDARMIVVLDTLEYLRRGGRISAAQSAIGSVLSVKPIITITGGVVETIDKPRTAGRARARLLELALERPMERLAVIHTLAPGIDAFCDELTGRAGLDPAGVITELIGPSVAPHAGPGAFGACILAKPG
jgi:DegV family protein with EDD domain